MLTVPFRELRNKAYFDTTQKLNATIKGWFLPIAGLEFVCVRVAPAPVSASALRLTAQPLAFSFGLIEACINVNKAEGNTFPVGWFGQSAGSWRWQMWLELTDTDGRPVVVNMDHVISFRTEGDRTSLNLNLAGRQTIEVKQAFRDLKARVGGT